MFKKKADPNKGKIETEKPPEIVEAEVIPDENSIQYIRENTNELKGTLSIIYEDYIHLQTKYVSELEKNKSPETKDLLEQKLLIIDKSLEKVVLGREETEILMILMKYFEFLTTNKMKVRMQLKRLYEENEWLKDELNSLQLHMGKINLEINAIENAKNQFKLLCDMRRKEYDLGTEDVDALLNEADDKDVEVIPQQLRTLHKLVMQYAGQGRYDIAVALLKQAQDENIKLNGPKHADTATIKSILALVYRDQGKFKDAVKTLEESLHLRDALFDKNDPIIAATSNNLAVMLVKCGRHKEAEPYCRRALEIRKASLGKNHPYVAKQLNNMALLSQNANKPMSEIEDLYKEAIRIYILKPEENLKNISKTKNNLVALYVRNRKFTEAEQTLKEILTSHHESKFKDCTVKREPSWKALEDMLKAGKHTNKDIVEFLLKNYDRITDDVMVVTTKNLSALYKMNKLNDASSILESWLLKSADCTKAPKQNAGKATVAVQNTVSPTDISKTVSATSKNVKEDKSKKNKSGKGGFLSKLKNKIKK